MTTFFTADTHIGHKNIITYCNRPFKDTDEMDEAIVRGWNARVGPGDKVVHLGDFEFAKRNHYRIMEKLNGNITLVQGNHDRRVNKAEEYGAKVLRTEGKGEGAVFRIDHHGGPINVSHYPPNLTGYLDNGKAGNPGNIIYLYGHEHGDVTPHLHNVHHVGQDSWNFMPVTLEEILQDKLEKLDRILKDPFSLTDCKYCHPEPISGPDGIYHECVNEWSKCKFREQKPNKQDYICVYDSAK